MKGRIAQVTGIALASLFAALIISAGILVTLRVPPPAAVKGSQDTARKARVIVTKTVNVKAS